MNDDLSRSLTRAMEALTRDSRSPRLPSAARRAGQPALPVMAVGGVALLLIMLGIVTQNHLLLKIGVAIAAVGAVLVVSGQAKSGPRTPGVSLGATIGAGAELDPTAAVEMGASVGERAKLGPGALVRMGANVEDGAVLEASAVVSWGADVGEGAVIGEGAIVGAGCAVGAGARVPPGFVLRPGSSFGARESAAAAKPVAPVPAVIPPADPRAARVEAACAKLTAELSASPDGVRQLLGNSGETVEGLRRTCAELLRREAGLRREADLGHLTDERAAIEARIEREQDGQIRESLRGALAAIDGQKKERELLRVAADRLDAEHTRLLYTLEQLAAQFARLRSAGQGAVRAPHELQQGVQQLRGELEAIADALESVALPPPAEDLAIPRPSRQRDSL